MQWIPINTAGHSHTWTLQNEKTVAELKFSLASQTMRVYATDIRQFFLEASGRYQQRMIITSEYGILLGELQFFTPSRKGSLYLNQLKYYFTEFDQGFNLMDAAQKSIASCKIETTDQLHRFEFASLVFGFVWIWQSMDLMKSGIATETHFNGGVFPH